MEDFRTLSRMRLKTEAVDSMQKAAWERLSQASTELLKGCWIEIYREADCKVTWPLFPSGKQKP